MDSTLQRRTTSLWLQLERDELIRLRRPAGVTVRCDIGCLWITTDGEPEDRFLDPGQQLRLVGPRPVVVSALGRAGVQLTADRAAGRAWSAERVRPDGRRMHLTAGVGIEPWLDRARQARRHWLQRLRGGLTGPAQTGERLTPGTGCHLLRDLGLGAEGTDAPCRHTARCGADRSPARPHCLGLRA